MNTAAPRHGALSDFLALTDGLSIARIAQLLRCCTRTIRNYVAGRSPIPWHRIEVLQLLVRAIDGPAAVGGVTSAAEHPAVVANIDPDPSSPDVLPDEMLAWVGVHASHFLSSQRSFTHYVRGWNVVDKIRRAKREGTFAAVLAQWRVLAVELPRMWRTGPLWTGVGPPAYRHRES
ncbi:TPA: IS21 family transposase [Burkholderia vietnamiensis]|uniref:IS21 family transposase n=1 Tax=Burkholderia vietnamiensis TaxID=60552 RepID=UPI001B9B7AF4|nr:IS21 family transposase [Burkholderia vietnamiensis]MBR7908579.1 IS21 family transposase [Burkholderia vietnamiensis]HDR9048600.1 IS21 family transposase [Burkholderia vietnamiensis]HDR9231857.1 IS21 family transposase [Burkholderia vietnamiensis]HDR9272433.1 IS21 family transposase [Burkholderia vietnamiensis]